MVLNAAREHVSCALLQRCRNDIQVMAFCFAEAVEGTTASGITLVGQVIGAGLQIVNNEFGGGTIYQIPELWPSFTKSTFEEVTAGARNCTAVFNESSNHHDCEGLLCWHILPR